MQRRRHILVFDIELGNLISRTVLLRLVAVSLISVRIDIWSFHWISLSDNCRYWLDGSVPSWVPHTWSVLWPGHIESCDCTGGHISFVIARFLNLGLDFGGLIHVKTLIVSSVSLNVVLFNGNRSLVFAVLLGIPKILLNRFLSWLVRNNSKVVVMSVVIIDSVGCIVI